MSMYGKNHYNIINLKKTGQNNETNFTKDQEKNPICMIKKLNFISLEPERHGLTAGNVKTTS